jgi:hypothetical protein
MPICFSSIAAECHSASRKGDFNFIWQGMCLGQGRWTRADQILIGPCRCMESWYSMPTVWVSRSLPIKWRHPFKTIIDKLNIAESPELSQRCLARNVRCLWSSCGRVWTYCGFLCRSTCQQSLFWCRCARQLVPIQDSLPSFKMHVKQSLECLTTLLKNGGHATTSAEGTMTSTS